MEALVKRFSTAAVGVQGSGWAWLGYDKGEDKLVVGATANQDPCSTLGLTPLCVLRCVLTRTRLLTRPTPRSGWAWMSGSMPTTSSTR